MSVKEVLRMGHPFLRQVAQPVEDPLAAEIQELIVDLRDTMQARNGAGLAAPQIGSPWRVVIYGTGSPNPRYPYAPIIRETVLINPVLEPIGTDAQTGWEGCLSVPGLRGEVTRWQRVDVRAMDQNGHMIQRRLDGFEARVIQHECDHLDGVLFPQRLASATQLGYIEELEDSGLISATTS
jgi:peptide deformylase